MWAQDWVTTFNSLSQCQFDSHPHYTSVAMPLKQRVLELIVDEPTDLTLSVCQAAKTFFPKEYTLSAIGLMVASHDDQLSLIKAVP